MKRRRPPRCGDLDLRHTGIRTSLRIGIALEHRFAPILAATGQNFIPPPEHGVISLARHAAYPASSGVILDRKLFELRPG